MNMATATMAGTRRMISAGRKMARWLVEGSAFGGDDEDASGGVPVWVGTALEDVKD